MRTECLTRLIFVVALLKEADMVGLKEGAKVVIYNTTLDGRTVREGEAILVKLIEESSPGYQRWQVRFDDEPENIYFRWVSEEDVL